MSSSIETGVDAVILGPDNSEWHPISHSFSSKVNSGIDWEATFSGRVLPTWGRDAKVRLRLFVEGFTDPWTSPFLHLQQARPARKANTTVWSGADWVSWMMGMRGVTQPTYTNQTVAYVMTQMATLAGVSLTGAPATQIEEYDLKRKAFKEHYERLVADMGYCYYVDSDGSLKSIPATQMNTRARDLYLEDVIEDIRYENQVDVLRLRKVSKLRGWFLFESDRSGLAAEGQLGNPLLFSTLNVQDLSTNGTIQYAAFYDELGRLGAFFRYDLGIPIPPLQVNSGAAYTVAWSMLPPGNNNTNPIDGKMLVTGVPPGGGGYDYGFELNYPYLLPEYTPQAPPTSRLRVETVETPIWPTIAFVQGIAAQKWQEMQKGESMVEYVLSRFDPWWMPCDKIPASGHFARDSRIEEISWQVSAEQVGQRLNCWVPTTLPTGAQVVTVPPWIPGS